MPACIDAVFATGVPDFSRKSAQITQKYLMRKIKNALHTVCLNVLLCNLGAWMNSKICKMSGCVCVWWSDLHQWRLEALLWIRQLLILRAAALCRYTAFFIIAGSFASISAAQIHSSKNPGYNTHIINTWDKLMRSAWDTSMLLTQNWEIVKWIYLWRDSICNLTMNWTNCAICG